METWNFSKSETKRTIELLKCKIQIAIDTRRIGQDTVNDRFKSRWTCSEETMKVEHHTILTFFLFFDF